MLSDFNEWEILQSLVESSDFVSLLDTLGEFLVFSDEFQELDQVIFFEVSSKFLIQTFSKDIDASSEWGSGLNTQWFFKDGDLIESNFLGIDENRLNWFSEVLE